MFFDVSSIFFFHSSYKKVSEMFFLVLNAYVCKFSFFSPRTIFKFSLNMSWISWQMITWKSHKYMNFHFHSHIILLSGPFFAFLFQPFFVIRPWWKKKNRKKERIRTKYDGNIVRTFAAAILFVAGNWGSGKSLHKKGNEQNFLSISEQTIYFSQLKWKLRFQFPFPIMSFSCICLEILCVYFLRNCSFRCAFGDIDPRLWVDISLTNPRFWWKIFKTCESSVQCRKVLGIEFIRCEADSNEIFNGNCII